MAEEWGFIAYKSKKCSEEYSDLFLEVLSLSGIERSEIREDNFGFSEFQLKDGYKAFDFECSEWREIAEIVNSKGSDIEFYARIYDEYGTAYFYLVNPEGLKLKYCFDQGGDLCEQEGYEDEVMAEIEKWANLVPANVKAIFPSLIETDDLEFDGP